MVGPPEDRQFPTALLRPVGIVMVAQRETAIQRTIWYGRNPSQLQLEDEGNQVQAALFFVHGDQKGFLQRTLLQNESRGVKKEKGERRREGEREKRQKETAEEVAECWRVFTIVEEVASSSFEAHVGAVSCRQPNVMYWIGQITSRTTSNHCLY